MIFEQQSNKEKTRGQHDETLFPVGYKRETDDIYI